MRAIILGTAVVFTLTGCARVAESRLNPFNWFGSSQEAEATAATPAERPPLVPPGRSVQVVDARALVTSISTMTIDRTGDGAIVRATGTVPTQGYFNAELVNLGVEGGVLTLAFRAEAPAGFEATGTARSRQITAAYLIESGDLAGVRSVRVQAAENARVSRR